MKNIEYEIPLSIVGLGIIMYSPESVSHIHEGQNYLRSDYLTAAQVRSHVLTGGLVGFSTSSPGQYTIRFLGGYPSDSEIRKAEFKLRLGIRCVDKQICIRDLYDLLNWDPRCPDGQTLQVDDGVYHATICSDRPASGVLGDNQLICIYLERLDSFPPLAVSGMPVLCM